MKKYNTKLPIYITYAFILFIVYWFIVKLDALTRNIYGRFDNSGIYLSPHGDILISILTSIFIGILLIIFLGKVRAQLWAMKAFFTLFIMIPYEAIYGLDSHTYFWRGIDYESAFNVAIWGANSGTSRLIDFTHYLSIILFDSYYSIKIFFSFLSFLGLIFLYKSYEVIIKDDRNLISNKYLIYVLFLLPSILMWSSSLSKDALNLFFVGFFIFGFIGFVQKHNPMYGFLIGISITGVFFIREWWSIIMLLTLFFYYLSSLFIQPNIKKTLIGILLLITVSALAYYPINVVLTARDVTWDNFFESVNYISRTMSYGNSSTNPAEIHSLGDYMLYYIPNLFTALYRPAIWDVRNILTLVSAIENSLLLYFSYQYIAKNITYLWRNQYTRFLIVYILTWSLLYVIISPPNLGAAIRFKLQVLPVILILIFIPMKRIKDGE